MTSDLVHHYFPDLTDQQKKQIDALGAIYSDWNSKVNLISRKDINLLYERHVLHSLGIAKILDFKPGSHVLDVGTGGGFPGIPLAILHPETEFLLVDSIGKKIKVVNDVASQLGLKNVRAQHLRAEQVKQKFDFVVSRAVTKLPAFIPWVRGKFKQEMLNAFPNGIFYLKGGDFQDELDSLNYDYDVFDLDRFFKEEFFETKKVVYVRMV